MTSDGFDLDLFLVEFVSECREATDLAVQDVLNLEQGRDQESVDRIFRALHSIKGNSSMFGLMALSEFVHKVEDTCSDIRSGERDVDKVAINVLLKSFDMIEDAFENILEKGSDDIDYSNGYALLKNLDTQADLQPSPRAVQPKKQPVTEVPVENVFPEVTPDLQPVSGMIEEGKPVKEEAVSEVLPEAAPKPKQDDAESSISQEESFLERATGQDSYATSNDSYVACPMASPVRKNPTALVVDDDFAARKIFVAFLSKFMPCYVAKDGVEAIQAVTESLSGQTPPFDLIVMDVMMPNIDGLQACKAIRQIEQSKNVASFATESKIFIASTLSDDKTMLKAVYECGADTYLIKPVSFDDLRRQLVRYRLIEPE